MTEESRHRRNAVSGKHRDIGGVDGSMFPPRRGGVYSSEENLHEGTEQLIEALSEHGASRDCARIATLAKEQTPSDLG